MRPSRAAVGFVAASIGFLVGAVTIAMIDNDDATTDVASPPEDVVTASSAPTADTGSVADAPVDGVVSHGPQVLLVWTSGGLAPGLAEATERLGLTTAVTLVRGDELALIEVVAPDGAVVDAYDDGWSVPLDVLAVDPAAHAPFAGPEDADLIRALSSGDGLLSRTSAELRGVGVGSTLTLRTGEVTIRGVIDDLSAAGAEVIVDHATGVDLGVNTDRFLLVTHDGERGPLQTAIDEQIAGLGAAAPVRFRAQGETTWLRHGDAVLPLAHVKARFGEFAVRDLGGRDVEIDPAWVEANIIDADLPIVGQVRCHREAVEPLRAALAALVDGGIAFLVDPEAFGGCFAARRINTGLPLSRHSWGIAVDINIGDNPRGSFTSQDTRLVDAMRSEGFGWGGTWLVPDPGHYEAIDFTSAE